MNAIPSTERALCAVLFHVASICDRLVLLSNRHRAFIASTSKQQSSGSSSKVIKSHHTILLVRQTGIPVYNSALVLLGMCVVNSVNERDLNRCVYVFKSLLSRKHGTCSE